MVAVYSTERLDRKKLEINDAKLHRRLRRVTPLIEKDGKLYTFTNCKPRGESFIFDPQDMQEVNRDDYQVLITSTPQFLAKQRGIVNPTIAEALAQMPDDDEITAFYLDEDGVIAVLVDAEGHAMNCTWLGKKKV